MSRALPLISQFSFHFAGDGRELALKLKRDPVIFWPVRDIKLIKPREVEALAVVN